MSITASGTMLMCSSMVFYMELGNFYCFSMLKELLSKAGKVVSFTMFMARFFHMKLLSKV